VVSNKKNDCVLVAGGGPVGSLSAYLLARTGIPVTLIEREAGVVLDYRASTIHPPTLDLLEECGAAQMLVDRGLIAPLWQFRDREIGKVAEFDLSLLKNDTRHPYRLQCEQFKLVEWLYGKLRAIPGVETLFEHELTGVALRDDGVEATVESKDGTKQVSGKYLIGCDGGRSTVRKALDIAFDGYTHPEHFLVSGTTFDFKSAMADICSVNYTADPVEWYLLLEIPDMWRIIMPVPVTVEATDAVTDHYIQGALQNLLPRSEPYEIVVRAIYRVSQRVAARYRKGRAFIAGDAAHINNPLGGMGLNGGIHDALSLTARLIEVWHGRASDSALDGYEPQRRPEAVNAINAITERNKKLMEERDPEVRRRNLDEWRRIAADRDRAYQYLLNTSMIASLRRSGMLT
jgi:3-(3-hydroxy-phenyl)propionate hydroxylase